MTIAPIRRQRHGINNRALTASLPRKVAEAVRAHAAARGVSVSSIVTEALRAYLGLKDDDTERAA